MRITTNMLSDATVQAGLSTGGNSLVNYLNGDQSDSLASSLGETHNSATAALSKKKYEKVKEAAENLVQYAENLNTEGSRSVYEKARTDGDATEVYDSVEKLVSGYNDMLDKLRGDTSTLGLFYRESLKEAVKENKEGLNQLGISIDKNGRMNIDKEKLRSADVSSVESIFGTAGTLSSKLGLIAEKVADSAQANIKSLSSQYNATGNSVDVLLRTYDAKG